MGRRCAMRHHARSRIGIVGFLVLLWGCSLSFGTAAAELAPVRIGLTREASAAPLLVAIAAGYLEAEGLDPQLTYFASDSLVSAAVAAAKIDIGMTSLSAPFYRYAAAHDLKMIASRSSDQTGFPMYALLISGKAHAAGLSGVRGLTHRRIGVADAESGSSYALFSIASRFGLDFGSIKTAALKSTAGELGALSRGEIDAALLPYAATIHAARPGQSLLLLSDLAAWQQGVVFTTATTIATRRDLTARFMRAYQRGTADYQFNFLAYDDAGDFIPGPHYDEYLHLIARQLRIPPDLLAVTKTYCDRRANLDAADIEKQIRFWQEQRRLDRRIAAADLMDLSFIGEETIAPQSSDP
jgi:NitT/TauT family transport system substrate-binding protein